jgi:transposase
MATGEVAMAYAPGAVERAMKVQEVIVQAIAGKLTWIQAAEILGCSARTIRRYRLRLEHEGYDGLFDRRRRVPSPKKAPVAELQRVLALYREHYPGFNVRHFHQLARRQHEVRFCYAFVKKALQSAGLVAKRRARGRHRRRREPRTCFGELLHLDGSRHRWPSSGSPSSSSLTMPRNASCMPSSGRAARASPRS